VTFFILTQAPKLFLAGTRAQWVEVGGRILLGDDTSGKAVLPRSIKFRCDGMQLDALLHTHTHTHIYIYIYIYIYRKGRDCRIGLVILDTPVSVILVLHSCKKHRKFLYHRKPVVTCRHTGKVDCFQCTATFVCFKEIKIFCRQAGLLYVRSYY